MDTANIIEIYAEATPNPESQKFVTNRHLLPNFQLDFRTAELAEGSELAKALFAIPFVNGVFIANNFVTVTKKAEYEWFEITPELKEAIKAFLQSGRKPVDDSLLPKDILETQNPNAIPADPESKIKDLLEKYVKPAIQMDGGHIEFKSFEDGVVKLSLQGSCSGCPSSIITLKSGIEGLLKRMVPEVEAVEAEAE
ncbi:MAG TPA: NifU family protein [Chitinophagales bacterium]|nr:NifU family protein [Chitinophagales bacterium]